MIYLKNNTETQAIYIPRQTVLSGGYIATTEKYEEGYNDGFKDGKEQQKDKLSNLYVTENGQYEREDGWNVVTVDVSIKYNTIADIYGSPSDSTVTFKGLVALSFEYGSGNYILFTDNTGSIILKNCQVPLMVGDECLVTATLRRFDGTYISALYNPSIEVLSSNNYVVMPSKAVELTNLDDLYIPNEHGYAEMKYLYADGTVARAPFDNFMRIETRQGNIGLRGNFSKWETKLAEGDNIRVYMFTENSHNVFFVTDIIKLGAEGGSCNLGILDLTLNSPNPIQKNASDDGYDGYSAVVVRPENIIAQEKERAINDFKNKMDEITITENGTYSIDSQETRQYIEFDGNSYFDTNIPFGENTKIEVAIINKFHKKEQIIGCAQYSLDEQSENYGGFGIVLWGDFAYGVFGRAKTNHIPSSMEEEQILTLDRNGIHSSFGDGASGWIDDSGLNDSSMYGTTIGIGKINSVANGWTYRGLNGRIRYVKIWTNKDDDSTLITYTPKTNGNFDANGVELQRLGEGTTTFVEENVKKYPNGFKRVEVNVPDLNGSYDEGYEQGQADIATNARVLNVTENGVYKSKFSDPIMPTTVTGVYANGTDFYSYAELNGKIFNTKIAGSIDRRLEFWYKGDNTVASDGWNAIIGAGNVDNRDCFQVRYWDNNNGRLLIEIGNSGVNYYDWDDTVWHHLIISKAEGLWIDGDKKWDFRPSNTINGEFLINGTGYNTNGTNTANGTFGMIKIDDTIIIPTADGFLNTNTGELLEVVKDGGYTFTENLPTYGEGELYKTINVNVKPKIDVKEVGLNFSYSSFTELPEYFDFKNVTNMYEMFANCTNLQTIPLIDTSKVTNMERTFYSCNSLQTIPLIDTSNVTTMKNMFYNCTNLQTLPEIDTSNVTTMYSMFYNVYGIDTLVSLPKFNCRKVTDMNYYFSYYNDMSALTDVGGWENLKCNWKDDCGLIKCPNLTYQSCINVLNGLYDFTGNGETPSSDQGQLKVHANFLTTVGDEISIGTNKGWIITA